MAEYPEHDKVRALGGVNQAVGNFIEWLTEHGYTICEVAPNGDYYRTRRSTEQLMFDHFEIDRNAFNAEKDRMLGDIQQTAERAQ